MLQGYVINLDRHPERLFQFYQQPDTSYFQRIPAVDKKVLELISEPDYLFNTQFIQRYIQRPITLGEIGCTLSHIKTWKYIAENKQLSDQDFAIVAEDDIQLVANFSNYMRSLLPQFISKNVDIILLQKLGLYQQKFELFNGGDVDIIIPKHSGICDNDGSSLYLIRKSKAKALIEKLTQEKPFWLADHFSLFCDLEKIVILSKLFGYVPDNAPSDLEFDREIARKK